MITDGQDEAIEQLQMLALRFIYGSRLSGRSMRQMADLQTLRKRRIECCNHFDAKCVASPRFEGCLPRRSGGRITRRKEELMEEYATCDRLFNSPLFYMRRRLNGKPGRKYGQRYSEYRESYGGGSLWSAGGDVMAPVADLVSKMGNIGCKV